MKYLSLLLITLTLIFCKSDSGAVLEKDSENYKIAKQIAEKVPQFDPDENEVILSTKDFNVTVADVILRMRSRFGRQFEQITQSQKPAIIKLFKELAESVAYYRITEDLAADKGITVSDAHIDSILQTQYKRAGSEEKYTEFIISNGISMETLREDIRTSEIQRMYFLERVSEDSALTESKIDSAMNGDRYASVRHILLMFKPQDSDSAKQVVYKKMEGILEKANAGDNFAELAKEYTEDPGSKNSGGLYENFEKGKMVPEFEEAAFNVPIGEISGIVETQYGYHILKIIDRKKEDRPREVVAKDLLERSRLGSIQKIYEQISEDYEFEFVEIDA